MSDRICDLCTDRDYRKKSQIRSVAVQRLGRISKKENKLVNVRYLGYIIAKLQKNIPSSCWDPFTSCNVPTNPHCQIIQPYSTLSFFGVYELWSTKFFTDVYPENLIFTLIAKIPNFSIFSFIGVYGSKFTKFSTLVEQPGDCLPWMFEGGLQQKILRESQKNLKFLHLHVQKRSLCLHPGVKGQGQTYIW